LFFSFSLRRRKAKILKIAYLGALMIGIYNRVTYYTTLAAQLLSGFPLPEADHKLLIFDRSSRRSGGASQRQRKKTTSLRPLRLCGKIPLVPHYPISNMKSISL
jgi:hypothetical protein